MSVDIVAIGEPILEFNAIERRIALLGRKETL